MDSCESPLVPPTVSVRHDEVRELLAYAWFVVGYPPVGSAVLVTLHSDETAAGDVTGLVARVDLPRRAEHGRLIGEHLARAAQAEGADAALLVVVQPARSRRPAVLVRAERALVRAAQAELGRAGVAVADVLVVAGDRYRSVLCDEIACCPLPGSPLGDLRTTVTGAAMVCDGETLAADEADLAADVSPRPWPPNSVPDQGMTPPAALERWRAAVARRMHGELSGEVSGVVPDGPPADPRPADVAWLVPALADLRLRDAVWATLLQGADDLADDLVAGRDVGRAALDRAEARGPDRQVLEASRALLAAVARGAAPGARADALALLAWMGWWQGRAARARLLAALALADQPGHRLAVIVDQLLLHGVRPAWVTGVSRGRLVP